MKIVQIIPHFPPNSHGIGDHAFQLGEQLLNDYAVMSSFIATPNGYSESRTPILIHDRFMGRKLPDYNPQALLDLLPLDTSAIIVHFGFYVCPLLCALQEAKALRKFKLLVLFHEVLLQAGWRLSVRDNLKRFLPGKTPGGYRGRYGFIRMADVLLTNNSKFQRFLAQYTHKPIIKIINFSTIGEPDDITPLSLRKRYGIVFGTRGTRLRSYFRLQKLIKVCQALQITTIYDVGPTHSLKLSELMGIEVICMGVQPPQAVSQIMSQTFAGFFDYSHNPGTFGKSGVFAAYSAHGILPISATYDPSERDGLEFERHYITPESSVIYGPASQLQRIATNAHQWYANHKLKIHAQVFAANLLNQDEVSSIPLAKS
jgi:hypothetical protein